MEKETKTAILWIVLLCGNIFHTIADMLPLFWSQNIAIEVSGHAPMGMMVFMSIACFMIPVCGVLLSLLVKATWGIKLNFTLSSLVLLLNIIHSTELLEFNPVQLPILPVILIVNIILCIHIWKSIKADKRMSNINNI